MGSLTSLFAAAVSFLQAGIGAIARSVQSKLRDTVSVLDFGAIGDGIIDDTAAIQAAMNSLNPAYGGTLLFPKPPGAATGSYLCGPLVNAPPCLTLQGDSQGGSIINYNQTTGKLLSGSFSLFALKKLYIQATGHTAGWCIDMQTGTYGAAHAITNITRANPGVISSGTTPNNGDTVYISGVGGMTQVNDNYYRAAGVVAGVSFQLTDPNTGAVVTTNYTAYGAGGTWQLVTAESVTRDLLCEDVTIIGFKNGIRAGQTINSTLQRMRLVAVAATPALTSDAIALQIGDAGFQGTSTIIRSVYCVGTAAGQKWGTGIWNKWCNGLVLDNLITENCMLGLRSDAVTVGSMHSESCTQSMTGTAPVNMIALNPGGWTGVPGAAFGDIAGWTSAASAESQIRGNFQWSTQVSLHAPVAETIDGAFRTLVFDFGDVNPDGIYTVGGTGMFTAPMSGRYRFHVQMTMAAITLADIESLRIIGGSGAAVANIKRQAEVTQVGTTFQLQLTADVFLFQNQTASIEHAATAGGAARNIYGEATGTFTYLTIDLL